MSSKGKVSSVSSTTPRSVLKKNSKRTDSPQRRDDGTPGGSRPTTPKTGSRPVDRPRRGSNSAGGSAQGSRSATPKQRKVSSSSSSAIVKSDRPAAIEPQRSSFGSSVSKPVIRPGVKVPTTVAGANGAVRSNTPFGRPRGSLGEEGDVEQKHSKARDAASDEEKKKLTKLRLTRILHEVREAVREEFQEHMWLLQNDMAERQKAQQTELFELKKMVLLNYKAIIGNQNGRGGKPGATCGNCNHSGRLGARFCDQCGTPLANTDVDLLTMDASEDETSVQTTSVNSSPVGKAAGTVPKPDAKSTATPAFAAALRGTPDPSIAPVAVPRPAFPANAPKPNSEDNSSSVAAKAVLTTVNSAAKSNVPAEEIKAKVAVSVEAPAQASASLAQAMKKDHLKNNPTIEAIKNDPRYEEALSRLADSEEMPRILLDSNDTPLSPEEKSRERGQPFSLRKNRNFRAKDTPLQWKASPDLIPMVKFPLEDEFDDNAVADRLAEAQQDGDQQDPRSAGYTLSPPGSAPAKLDAAAVLPVPTPPPSNPHLLALAARYAAKYGEDPTTPGRAAPKASSSSAAPAATSAVKPAGTAGVNVSLVTVGSTGDTPAKVTDNGDAAKGMEVRKTPSSKATSSRVADSDDSDAELLEF